MDSHHLPEGTHSLAPRPGTLDRWTFPPTRGALWRGAPARVLWVSVRRAEPKLAERRRSAWQVLHLHWRRFELRASALGYTRVLAHGHWCPRPGLHRHCARFKCAVSALDYVGERAGRAEARARRLVGPPVHGMLRRGRLARGAPRAKAGGSPRCCPVLCGLRDRCIAAMLATQTRHAGGVEPPRPGL